MTDKKDGSLSELPNIMLRNATDEELTRLKSLSDDDLLRSAQTMDMFAGVESTRRLRAALHKEEVAIKWLTGVLVVLTAILAWPVVQSFLH